jgi:anti-sigma factor RsiW
VNSVNCRIAAPWVTAIGSGEDVAFAPVRNHIETCLYCQASVARHRRLRRSLEDLASVSVTAPAGASLFPTESPDVSGRPLVVGVLGAALAVGIGVIGIRRTLAH